MSLLFRLIRLPTLLTAALLAGCSTGPSIDTRYQASSQDSRVAGLFQNTSNAFQSNGSAFALPSSTKYNRDLLP